MATPADSIFVSIASYRDPECQWTIRDLFEKARRPDRVFVGLCFQFISPDDDDCFEVVTRPEQVRCTGFDARQSLGACWAKTEAQRLWQGEDYVLQIDSHMRFDEGWDESAIGILRTCPSGKPILSTYPAPYNPPDTRSCSTPHLVAKSFDPGHRLLTLIGHDVSAPEPIPGVFVAGGFMFASSRLIEEVPYDPALYFYGEELSFAVRAWTRGYDMFSPHRCFIHHHYERPAARTHWGDHADWYERDVRSRKRVYHLLGMEPCGEEDVIEGLDGAFGLGSVRTLAEYQAFAGLCFCEQTIREGGLARAVS